MSKQTINVGSGELTGNGESIRSAFVKVNNNFNEVYSDLANVNSAIDGIVIPTNVSVFNNDVGYIKDDDLPTALSQLTNDTGYIASTSTLVNGAYKISVNNSGDLVFPNNTVQNTAWTGTVNANQVVGLSVVSTSGSYVNLSNRPTKLSEFINDNQYVIRSKLVRDLGTTSTGDVNLDFSFDDIVLVTAEGNFNVTFSNLGFGLQATLLVKNTSTVDSVDVNIGIPEGNMSNGTSTVTINSMRTGHFVFSSLTTSTADLYCQAVN
jgi:hypothetical protein